MPGVGITSEFPRIRRKHYLDAFAPDHDDSEPTPKKTSSRQKKPSKRDLFSRIFSLRGGSRKKSKQRRVKSTRRRHRRNKKSTRRHRRKY